MSWLKKFLPLGEEPRQNVSFGFQVLKNTNKFIAIEPWFDFICGINGRIVEDGNSYLFSKEVANCAGRDISFSVWSAKGQKMRDVMVSVPKTSLSLGLTLQWCPVSTTEDIWHILDVAPGSPADYAGLLPQMDYIIGTPTGIVRGESGLGELVEDHMDRVLRLYVYNREYDVTRELHITPTRTWGGEGALGCVLGFGALHRIPAPLHEPVQAPGETLFSNTPRPSGDAPRSPEKEPHPKYEDEEFPPTEPGRLITPATTTVSPYQFTPIEAFRAKSPAPHPLFPPAAMPQPGAARPPPRHKGRHAREFDTNMMDDYLREGELKSRELEGNSSGGGTGKGVPPPPKGGVPPPPRRGLPPGPPPPRGEKTTPEREDELD